jgi:hypothetical protein
MRRLLKAVVGQNVTGEDDGDVPVSCGSHDRGLYGEHDHRREAKRIGHRWVSQLGAVIPVMNGDLDLGPGRLVRD